MLGADLATKGSARYARILRTMTEMSKVLDTIDGSPTSVLHYTNSVSSREEIPERGGSDYNAYHVQPIDKFRFYSSVDYRMELLSRCIALMQQIMEKLESPELGRGMSLLYPHILKRREALAQRDTFSSTQ